MVTMNKCDTEEHTVDFTDGTPVKRVNTATYLGITCNHTATQTPNLNSRLGKASEQFNKLHLFWRHTNITQKMKLQFFKQIFHPMILYGLEYSTITQGMEQKMDAWQANHLRRVLNIKVSMISHETNASVLKKANDAPLSVHIYSRQLKYFGHVLRANTDTTEHTVCFDHAGNHAMIRAKKRVGRPKYHWAPNLMDKLVNKYHLTQTTHLFTTPSSASLLRPFKDLALDRRSWARLVAAPTRAFIRKTDQTRGTQ